MSGSVPQGDGDATDTVTVDGAVNHGVDAATWPTRLVFQRGEKRLNITFMDGNAYDIPFELLRVESPSAEVQGHGPGGKTLVLDKADVGVTAAEPVGRYAVRIVFDDGHDTGLFTWAYLRNLGEHGGAMLADYRARLAGA